MFEARDADTGHKARLMLAALVRVRREFTYEVDAASLMMTTENGIPIDAIHELPLVHALVEHRWRFAKPLRYDAPTIGAIPNALLLNMELKPVPLHVVSAFMAPKARGDKEREISRPGEAVWVWATDQPMPPLPVASGPQSVASA